MHFGKVISDFIGKDDEHEWTKINECLLKKHMSNEIHTIGDHFFFVYSDRQKGGKSTKEQNDAFLTF